MYEAAAQLVERSAEGAESAALLDLLRQEKCTLPKEARGRGAGGVPGKREQVVLHLEGDDSAYLAEKAQQRAEQRQQVCATQFAFALLVQKKCEYWKGAAALPRSASRCASVYLLYWHKGTHTDAQNAVQQQMQMEREQRVLREEVGP
jgi:hypothetical protein